MSSQAEMEISESDNHSDPTGNFHREGLCETYMPLQQDQQCIFRSLQASKQMVFGVFENIIGDLEELEQREKVSKDMRPIERSAINIPDQRKKKASDVESITDSQLLIFQMQLQKCPPEVREKVRGDMIKQTLNWCAAREGRELTKIDEYAAKLYEVLQTGITTHPREFSQPPQITKTEMHETVSALIVGQHQQREQDKSFKDDPTKKAEMKKIRSGDALVAGIERIWKVRPDLEDSLKSHMENSIL